MCTFPEEVRSNRRIPNHPAPVEDSNRCVSGMSMPAILARSDTAYSSAPLSSGSVKLLNLMIHGAPLGLGAFPGLTSLLSSETRHTILGCAPPAYPLKRNQFIEFRMSSFICLDRPDTVGNGIEINGVAAVVTTRFFRVRRFRLEFQGPHALITNAGESR